MIESSGKLDGTKILRYAHIYKELSGGIETYLSNLNRMILLRNRMTVYQMYLAEDEEEQNTEIEEIGKGKLIWLPCHFLSHEKHRYSFNDLRALAHESDALQLPMRILRCFRHEYLLLQGRILDCIRNDSIDMISFHWLNHDSKNIIAAAIKNDIPYVYINHFENQVFNRRVVKQQTVQARALAGVTSVDVPYSIQDRFTGLYDGVDTEFFKLENASYPDEMLEKPVILLPSRIVEGKGHEDLIVAAAGLRRKGARLRLAFAGRTDSESLIIRLKSLITKLNMENSVVFLGNLDPGSLRNWYAYSDVVVLPTRFMEGIPRVLLEAQAMTKPVIAYEAGGVREAMRNGETGFLVSKGDITQLGETIKDLIENDEKKSRMGQRGRDFILDRFSLLKLVERHENFLSRALRQP